MEEQFDTHLETLLSHFDESLDALVQRARAEFQEMPGLRLTFGQLQRLLMLDPSTCQALVERLLQARILTLTPSGQYVRCGSREGVSPQRAC